LEARRTANEAITYRQPGIRARIPRMDGIQDRLGERGQRLALWGTLGFAALAPVSIALSQICVGLTAVGLVLSFTLRRQRYRLTGLEVPLAAFLVAEALAVALAVDRQWSMAALEDDWPLLLVPLFAQAFRDSKDVRRAFLVLLASSSVASLFAIWQVFNGWDPIRHRTLDPVGQYFIGSGFFGHHLTFGGIVLIPATLALGLLAASPAWRLAVVTCLLLSGLVASFARTAWLGAMAAVVTLAALVRGTMRRLMIAALLVGAGAALVISPIRLRLSAVLGFGDDPRVRLWETALRIWKAHPVLGAGPGSFKLLFEEYKVPGTYMATCHPHNDFLKVLDNAGIVGFVAFASIWVFYFRHVTRARRRLPSHDPRRQVLQAGIVVVVAFLVAATGQCFLSDETVADLFWFFVAGVLVTAGEARRDWREVDL
jgi:O-antigen ligase